MEIPSINTIEFTNACNFSCRYCQRNNEDGKRPTGFLDVSVVEKLVSEDAFVNTSYIEFQQNGEPTLHPHFAELAAMLRGQVKHTGMSTNATFMHLPNRDRVLEAVSEMDLITVSVHPETREDDIISLAKALEGLKTRIRVQTLAHEFYALRSGFIEGLPNVVVDNYDLREFGKRYGDKRFCADLFYGVTIQWDADVVPCCNVVGKQKVLGNVMREPLRDIWARHDTRLFDYCKTCRTSSPFARRLQFFDECINI